MRRCMWWAGIPMILIPRRTTVSGAGRAVCTLLVTAKRVSTIFGCPRTKPRRNAQGEWKNIFASNWSWPSSKTSTCGSPTRCLEATLKIFEEYATARKFTVSWMTYRLCGGWLSWDRWLVSPESSPLKMLRSQSRRGGTDGGGDGGNRRPFLAPMPHRGKRCEPACTRHLPKR